MADIYGPFISMAKILLTCFPISLKSQLLLPVCFYLLTKVKESYQHIFTAITAHKHIFEHRFFQGSTRSKKEEMMSPFFLKMLI